MAPPRQEVPSAPPPDQPCMDVRQEPLSHAQVKEALAAFVAQHCCYGKGPIERIQIRSVTPSATFKYTLETFIEKRETKWKSEPSSGRDIATSGAPAPGPWDIPLTPKQPFKNEKRTMEVPNTQCLRPCSDCQAHGDVRCKHCAGRGHDTCRACGGSGQRLQDQCARCGGTGTTECTWCHRRGMVQCTTCRGQRNLKYFVELSVTWEALTDKYVVETPGLPDGEVARVSGETVCQSEGRFVWPFTGFPETRVADASNRLVSKHQKASPMARVLQQRQDVQLIPIQAVGYQYGDSAGAFYICGEEHGVYYPDYPSTCCGCCAIV